MHPYRTDDVPGLSGSARRSRVIRSRAQRVAGLLTIVLLLIPLSALVAPAIARGAEVLTLEDAYARARARSSELKLLEEKIVEAEINVARAWSLLKPVWNASFSYVHTEPQPPPIDFPPLPDFRTESIRDNCVQNPSNQQFTDCFNGVLEVLGATANAPPITLDFARDDTVLAETRITWNIFNGRAIPLIKNAYDAVDLERVRSSTTLYDLLLGVARAYYAALATQQAIGAAKRAQERADEELAIAQQKAELGETIGSQRRAAEIAARQAATDVRRAENAHQQALSAIALLTRSEGTAFDVAAPPVPLRPEGDAEALKSKARSLREELRSAELAITIAERGEQEAWWKFAPTLSVFGGYRWSNVAGISGQKEQWSVGLVAAAQLYDGGLRYRDLEEAQSRLRSAQLLAESTRSRVDNEVERALMRLDAAAMNIERAEDAVSLAKEKRALVQSQFDVGAMRGVELREANDAVLNSELAVIRARRDEAIAILELQRSVGAFAP